MEHVAKSQPILVGVSGGADSMALWHWLVSQGYEVIACYIHHHQRPEENQQEIKLIQAFGTKVGSKVEIQEISPMLLESYSGNFQNFAREQRYQIWQKLLLEHKLRYLALAHHNDDLLETVLMRLVRGTSPQGLIPFQASDQRKNYVLLRPFYAWTKVEIYHYCQQQGVPFCEDSSNQKDVYLRNRYRHQVIPLLERENPTVAKQVRQFIDQLQQVDDYLMQEAEKIAKEITKQHKKYLIVSINLLKNKPIALQSAVFKIILRYVYSHENYFLSETVFNRLFEMSERTTGSEQFIWQQHIFERNYELLYIYRSEDYLDAPDSLRLNELAQHFGDYQVFTIPTVSENTKANLIYPSEWQSELIVRSVISGDKIMLADGKHKKIARMFIDAKIPRFLRSSWPIVEYNGQIIWIYGIWQAQMQQYQEQKMATLTIKEEK
ncbi:MAG: tRNA lysidine(34) synthetase TilS [Culicoidibacterales bacterium]